MGPNRRAQERARTAARAAAEAKRAEAERKAVADAQKVVAIWNARQAGGGALWFYPTIGAAIAAGVPWLSFSCRDGATTSAGEPIADAMALGDHPRLVAVGVNCTAPRHLSALLAAAAEATERPRIAYPNGGDRWDATARRWVAEGDGAYDPGAVASWTTLGATWLGGCCGTGPREIAALAAAVREEPRA